MPARSPLIAKLDDHAWLRARRAEGWSVTRIRAELGTSTAAVRAALAAAGLPAKLPNPGPAFPDLYDTKWMRQQLRHHTVTDIARHLGCSTRSARDAARRAGVPPRRRTPRPSRLADAAWLEEQLRSRTYDDIASRLGCSVKAVARAVRHHDLSTLARRRRRFPELYDAAWVQRSLANKAVRQVAQELGCSVEAVRAAKRRMAADAERIAGSSPKTGPQDRL